ncbi:hypothetical protein [Corynebacterium guangdongense]|nr:hypothetical protein [Corynebacterium guangdongense]
MDDLDPMDDDYEELDAQRADLGPLTSPGAEEVLRDIESDGLRLEESLDVADSEYIEAEEGARIIVLAHLAAGEESDLPSGLDEGEREQLRDPRTLEALHELLNTVLYDTRSELRQERRAEGVLNDWVELNRWPQPG